jgi:hypothetical protein
MTKREGLWRRRGEYKEKKKVLFTRKKENKDREG